MAFSFSGRLSVSNATRSSIRTVNTSFMAHLQAVSSSAAG
jgi:hypothetical protein